MPHHKVCKENDSEVCVLAKRARDAAAGGRIDEVAWKRLYELLWRYAFARAAGITGDKAAAEDIAMKAFTKAAIKIEKWNPDDGCFGNWLLTLVECESIDWLRRFRPQIFVSIDEKPEVGEELAESTESFGTSGDIENVHLALGRLRPECQLIFKLRFGLGDADTLSDREIARLIGVSHPSVASRYRGCVRTFISIYRELDKTNGKRR